MKFDDYCKGVTLYFKYPVIRNSFSVHCNNTNTMESNEQEIHLVFI